MTSIVKFNQARKRNDARARVSWNNFVCSTTGFKSTVLAERIKFATEFMQKVDVFADQICEDEDALWLEEARRQLNKE